MLRTPSAIEGEGGAIREDVARERNRMLQVRDQMAQLAADNGLKVSDSLLATPTTQDSSGKCRDHGGDLLHDVTCGCERADRRKLLPTTTTRDFKDGSAVHERDGVVQTDTVARAVFNSGEVGATSWGKFEPAIRRWERVTGRAAPAPTKPDGKDGNHRLSSEFTEWMMGLGQGWVTGVGLSRVDELKACGNGVVPQQALLALRMLLDDVAVGMVD